MADFERCFQQVRLGPLDLKNRIFVSAHTTNFGHDFMPTQRHVDFHRARAKGGVGLIITEGIRVHPTSIGRPNCIVGYKEESEDAFRAIAEAVHEHGTRIMGQLVHTGRHNDNLVTGSVAWAPSATRWNALGRVPHAMEKRDIAELTDYYVRCALLLERAGFDGIEVHFGHGHLVHQFLSLNSNERTDEYGGSLENRTRLGIELVTAVEEAVGPGFAVGIRISADDFVPGGMGLDATLDMVEITRRAVPRLDFINVSHAEYTSPSIGYHVADMNYGDAPFVHLPTAVAERFPDVPVMGLGRMTSIDIAERVLAETKISMIGMTRAHIADPQIMRKAQEGRVDEIRPCVSCNYCIGELNRGLALSCMMNPTSGREKSWPDDDYGTAAVRRKVLVIGAGPAGLEAARVAATRGHDVHVWEQDSDIGGALRVGARGTGRSDLRKLVDYERRQLDRIGVQIRTGVTADRAMVESLAPDHIVIATGAAPTTEISLDAPVLDAAHLIGRPADAGQRVVLLDFEGAWRAASAAETLATAGHDVSVLSPGAGLFWEINSYSQMLIVDRLKKAGVKFYTLARILEWNGTDVRFTDGSDEDRWIRSVDTVCVSSPGLPRDNPLAAITEGYATSVIGDALAPRDLLQVMYQGHEIGRRI
ncbi:FAD-dependent oxidoreductase [Oceanicola sp. 22II-s10i]|uniref:oxidoreductase n=1 Tax=Oceanicola sp. 22II-s10i TaxID=1317116 RepID=UPI000B5287A8|nr:FAD-dependent oxidoreductase [Oceanicola sp. 22II-s10i]